MAGVIENRSTYGDLVKGMSAKFYEVFNQAKDSYSLAIDEAVAQQGNNMTALFKKRPTGQARERTVVKTGANYLVHTPEGSDFSSDSRLIAYVTEYAPAKFTQSITVTYEAIQDRDYREALDEFADLTITGKETMDKLGFNLFNRAFTAVASIPVSEGIAYYGDQKPLCSTIHPRKDGGTALSNASSSGIALTDANLEVARVALQNQLDDRGKPMRVGTGKLILLVPPALEKTAVVVTKSEKRSGTANNDINIYDGLMTVISSQWISAAHDGSDTAWFLIDPRVAKLMFMLREDLKTSRFVDNGTKSVTFDIFARWAQGWSDWRGVWGSKGDGAAYAL